MTKEVPQNDIPQANEPETSARAPEPRRARTFDDDVSRAMNATDAATVQEFLTTARAREAAEKAFRIGKIRRKWYATFAIFFTVCALASFAYAIYHYYRLTVPVERSVSVGVFPSTPPIVAGETTIEATVAALAVDTSLAQDRPVLVPLVTDGVQLVPISKQDFFSFIKAAPTEPFMYAIESIRLGAMNDGAQTAPFIILSVPDAQIASKEFLIAEKTLLELFSKALGITEESVTTKIGVPFESTYLYNMPVRMLTEIDPETGAKRPVLLYGYATEHVIVITANPASLKAVYDQLIRQR